MTDRSYRFAADTARRLRRVSLTPSSEYRVNEFYAWLMSQPPNYENFGRTRYMGGWRNLSTSDLPAREIAKQKSIQVVGHKPQGRRITKVWDQIPHGTASSYSNHCRKHPQGPCEECKTAWAAYHRRRYKERKHDC